AFLDGQRLASASDHPVAVVHFDLELNSFGGSDSIDRAGHFNSTGRIQDLYRLGEHIADKNLRHGPEPHRPADAASFEIIHPLRTLRRALGRNIAPAGVNRDIERIVAGLQPVSDFIAGGEISTEVLRQFVVVDVWRHTDHDTFELYEYTRAPEFRWKRELPAIRPELLPCRGIPVLP